MSISPFLEQSWNFFKEKRQLVYHILFFLVWVFTIYTGAIGVDFRSHWDEHKLFKSIRNSIPLGNIVPGWYNYPSMIYDLTVLSASREILTTYLADRATFRENMQKQLLGKELREFTQRARMVFLVITSLTLLWSYLLVLIWTKQGAQALLSSAILASSWEFAYHARWIAPDAILMQFGILTVLLVFVSFGSAGRRKYMWLIAAAVAAGMACGTKYFGGIFLVPVFVGGYKLLKDSGSSWRRYIVLFSALVAVFTFTFLLITPGALIDTARMIQDVRYEIGHYQAGDMGYTVSAGWQHLSLLLVYLFGVFFSKSIWVSLLFSVFVLIGLYSLLKTYWKTIETWAFLSVPLLFIPYMSQQRVMMVRNDLLLFPFLAILSARGIYVLWSSMPLRSNMVPRTILAAVLVLALFLNFNWLHYAGQSIVPKLTTDWPQKLQSYLVTNKETTFYLSTGARSLVDLNGLQNVTSDPSLADKLVFVFDEVDHPLANRPNIYDPIFGPYEVNFDYYPSWNEDKRIIVMPMQAAFPQDAFAPIFE